MNKIIMLSFMVFWTETKGFWPFEKKVRQTQKVECMSEAQGLMRGMVMSGYSPAGVENLNDVKFSSKDSKEKLDCLGVQIIEFK